MTGRRVTAVVSAVLAGIGISIGFAAAAPLVSWLTDGGDVEVVDLRTRAGPSGAPAVSPSGPPPRSPAGSFLPMVDD